MNYKTLIEFFNYEYHNEITVIVFEIALILDLSTVHTNRSLNPNLMRACIRVVLLFS